MNIVALLASFIYLVSSSLLLPVLLLLSLITVWLLTYSGQFFGLWLARRRLSTPANAIESLTALHFNGFSAPVRAFGQAFDQVRQTPGAEIAVLNLLRDTEHGMWRSLDRLKMLIRIGPGLGLMGTLIPLGTGLAALGQGDLTRLSGDLVIAFTTTVVGMALGLLSYFFFTIQRRWVEEDVKNMELLCEVAMREERS
ncbi:MotA/TolQ/ExbB proton channel family protein [Desulfonatronum sp. SC1]|uniref:MotA/TolQ/ExbB proton channel family protein n=1 Tax=Desulfonatronum sp. SC1 TaxID=2109626 RepID=UPI000D2FCD2F|nr:MotA/TolQ/ExbB proton channel family protein [Desulfonatronum sp. SC1]PTN35577.1 biopolymer transporter [Desulfonatronum sp. SC1]